MLLPAVLKADGVPKSSDKYPVIHRIVPDKDFVWTIGRLRNDWHYQNGFIFRFDRKTERWETIFKIDGERLPFIEDVKVYNEKVVFRGMKSDICFDKLKQTWTRLDADNQDFFTKNFHELDWMFLNPMSLYDIEERSVLRAGHTYLVLEDQIVKLKDGRIIQTFPLPQPPPALFQKYYERALTRSDILKNSIGPFFVEAERIWFGIIFSSGELFMTGCGGIGFFDMNNETWGLFHPKAMATSSIDAICHLGQYLWLGTSNHAELGPYPVLGLAIFGRSEGRLQNFRKNQGLDGELVSHIIRDGRDIWLATENGISRYDTTAHELTHYRAGRVVVDSDRTAVFPGISIQYLNIKIPSQPKGDTKKGEEFEHVWSEYWTDQGSFYEIYSNFETAGWVKKKEFEALAATSSQIDWESFDIYAVVYADDFATPIGFVAAANLIKLEEKEQMVKVSTTAGWIEEDQAYPAFSQRGNRVTMHLPADLAGRPRFKKLEDQKCKTASEFMREEAAAETEILVDEDCVLDENHPWLFFPSEKQAMVQILADSILSRYAPVHGALKGIFGFWIRVFHRESAEFTVTGQDFWGQGKGEYKKIEKGMEIAGKSQDNRYEFSVKIVDFRIGETTLGPSFKSYSGSVLEWVKCHVKIAKRNRVFNK